MQHIDHMVHAKWLISGEENAGVLDNHTLLIDKGIITDILPTAVAQAQYEAQRVDDYPYHAILPGFVNAHTHAGMGYFRGLGSDLELMDWLNRYIWPAEKKWLSAAFVKDVSLFAMAEMIRGGTTCFNDMFYFPEATAEAAEIAGMRAFIGMTVIEFPTPWAETTDAYFTKGLAFYEAYKNHPLVTPTLAPHAPYTVSDASFIRIKELAESLSLKINLHLHETATEVSQSLAEFNKRPIQRLYDLGLMSSQLVAIHATQLNQEDIAILAATKTNIVHCPISNMKLASGICPIDALQKLGVNIALGTDSVASNNDLDMISEMKMATLLSKVTTADPTSFPVAATLRLASLGGAKALGVDHQMGSLKKGKAADFIALDLNHLETLPVHDPAIQMVYSSSRHQVSDVWVDGKQLMKNRVLLTLDEEAIKDKARLWRL